MKSLFFLLLYVPFLYSYIVADGHSHKDEILNQIQSLPLKEKQKVSTFYRSVGYRFMWDERDLKDFINATRDDIKNYLFRDYHQDDIEDMMVEYNNEEGSEKDSTRVKLDLLATDGFFMLSHDLNEGDIDWKKFQSLLKEYKEDSEINLVWEKSKSSFHYTRDLIDALKENMLEVLFNRYQPKDVGYEELVKAYHRYSAIKKFPKVHYGKLMKVGDYGYRASELKKFLYTTGDLVGVDKKYIEFPTFDNKLSQALKRFQRRHYIKDSGVLDRVTVLYTRKSLASKLETIRLNIERYKLFKPIYNSEYIIVNIPEFSLKYYKNSNLLDDIYVVVGREDRPTPIFSDRLEYIVLNPSWIVPKNLMRKDYIPELVQDPYALEKEDIHIHIKPYRSSKEIDPSSVDWEKYMDEDTNIPYYFIQYPGEKNVLGAMKFIFPNRYNVYLHDTNSKSLTTLKYRLYSSGCIRLSKPYRLLEILSNYTNYSYNQLIEMINDKKSHNIKLSKKIPIYIRYFTAFIDKSGSVSFRRDFYTLDKIQSTCLSN